MPRKPKTPPFIPQPPTESEALKSTLDDLARSFRQMMSPKGRGAMRYFTLYEFVAKHGVPQRVCMLPQGLKRGRPRHCFDNALRVVCADPARYIYTEGYACIHAIPVNHAWVTPRHTPDIAFDVTWPLETSVSYVGVRFHFRYVLECMELYGNSFCLLDQWEARWPLLKKSTDLEYAIWTPKK